MLRSTVFSLLFVLFSLVTTAQVMYKEHELDIIGDFRLSDNRQIYGVRIAYPILNLRSLNKVYHFPVQLYGGLDYTTGGVALGYSFGLRMAFFRSNLDKTLYAVQNVHLRATDPTIDSFDKEEHLVAVGAGYKLQEQLAVEYLYGVNPYRATPIHNFAVAKTLRFQTTKRLKRKTQPLDCPPEQRE